MRPDIDFGLLGGLFLIVLEQNRYPDSMNKAHRNLSVVAFLIVTATIGGYFAARSDAPLPSNNIVGDAQRMPVAGISVSGMAAVAAADTNHATPPRERSVLVPDDSDVIFEDVPESEIDHLLLEEYLKIRPSEVFRVVKVDADLLRTRIRESADRPLMTIQLFGKEPVILTSSYAAEHSEGWKSGIGMWRGSVVGDELSRASFVVGADGSVNGEVMSVESGRVKIEVLKGTAHHIIWKFGTYAGPIESID